MKIAILPVVLFITGIVSAQDILSKIPKSGTTINAFIPKGYDTLSTTTGDLNKDGLSDAVLALASAKETNFDPAKDDIDSMPPRLLLILFNTGKGYMLAGKSAGALLCKECGGVFGDPFSSLVIDKNILTINHYGGSSWRWGSHYKFRYQQNDFYLIGRTSYSYWNVERCEKLDDFAGADYKDENLVTGSYEERKISQEGCKLLVNKKGKQTVKPLIKLNDFNIEN
ncbi:MAG: hypothetical protein ABI480_18955 [Chitinophagaceae bacterium]